jgi:hypothetical protein
VFDNASFQAQGKGYDKPPSDAFWARLSLQPGETVQASLGMPTKRNRTPGVIFLQIFGPLDKGMGTLWEIADYARKPLKQITVNGVVFKTPSVTNGGRQDSGEHMLLLQVPYHADIIE